MSAAAHPLFEALPGIIHALMELASDPFAAGLILNLTTFNQFEKLLILVVQLLYRKMLASFDATIDSLEKDKYSEKTRFSIFHYFGRKAADTWSFFYMDTR